LCTLGKGILTLQHTVQSQRLAHKQSLRQAIVAYRMRKPGNQDQQMSSRKSVLTADNAFSGSKTCTNMCGQLKNIMQ